MKICFRGTEVALVFACALTAGCTAGAQTPAQAPDSAVTLAISFPTEVTINRLPAAGAVQPIPLTAQFTLTNPAASAVTLQRPNECQTHVWTVSDGNGSTIDDRAICPMIFIPVKLSIAAHGTFTGTQTVMLAGTKYQDGGRYTLHYTFWGIEADAPFTVHAAR